MPFKSKAQQRFMFAAEARGEVPKGTAQEWADATKKQKGGFKALPEKVKPVKKSSSELAKLAISSEMASRAIDNRIMRDYAAELVAAKFGPGGTVDVPPLDSPQDWNNRARRFLKAEEEWLRKKYPRAFNRARWDTPSDWNTPRRSTLPRNLGIGAGALAAAGLGGYGLYRALRNEEPKEKQASIKKSAAEMAEEIVKKTGTPFVKKEAASTCSTPGEKIRSQGQGQGLARGGGKGPMGRPKLTSPEIADKVLEGKKKAETP